MGFVIPSGVTPTFENFAFNANGVGGFDGTFVPSASANMLGFGSIVRDTTSLTTPYGGFVYPTSDADFAALVAAVPGFYYVAAAGSLIRLHAPTGNLTPGAAYTLRVGYV